MDQGNTGKGFGREDKGVGEELVLSIAGFACSQAIP